jgi:deoxyadenosine/deoxycytidine kinase
MDIKRGLLIVYKIEERIYEKMHSIMSLEAESPYVVVSGNMGVGKTTLTGLLSCHLGCQTLEEPVLCNPYLEDFYRDKESWAFHYQCYFLGYRASRLLKLCAQPGLVICDRCVYEDAYVFAHGLYEDGVISDRDYNAYRTTYEVIEKCLPKPKLLLYLNAPVQLLMNRITSRGISSEVNGVDKEYLQRFAKRYDEWINNFNLCPVLRVDTEAKDLLTDGSLLEIIAGEIREVIGSSIGGQYNDK